MNSRRTRSGIIYLLLVVALGAFLYTSLVRRPDNAAQVVPLADVAEMVRDGRVAEIRVKDDKITVVNRATGTLLQSRKELDVGLVDTLANLGVTADHLRQVDINVEPPRLWESWGGILFALLPILLLGAFFFFIMRQAQGAGNQAFSFGKSRARMFTGDRPTVTFTDVAGNDEAKQEPRKSSNSSKSPRSSLRSARASPKACCSLARPVPVRRSWPKPSPARPACPSSASPARIRGDVRGRRRQSLRDLFEQAKKNAPCIIFVDEIDAVGRHRGSGMGGSHDEREQTLNQILVEMDGFDTDTNVILIAATNRPDILDPALLRPGRFDRRVTMDAPDVKGRRAILDVHVRGKPLAADVDLDVIAKQTPGFAGADIENLVNEAAILAARRNRRSISMSEFKKPSSA